MTQRSPDADLSALLDAVVSGEITPDRLALYATNPEAIDPDERRQIEAAVAASPALADQLQILCSFDASAALDESARVDAAPDRAREIRFGAPPPRRRWLFSWAPAVAAAA